MKSTKSHYKLIPLAVALLTAFGVTPMSFADGMPTEFSADGKPIIDKDTSKEKSTSLRSTIKKGAIRDPLLVDPNTSVRNT